MITLEQARTLQGRTLYGSGGEKLGKIDTLYADREDGEPTFATVHTGAFGTKTSFVPLSSATMRGDDVEVPYGKELVHSAPKVDPDAELSPEEEQRLYSHYESGDSTGTTDTGLTAAGGGTSTGFTEGTTTTGTTTGTTGGTGYEETSRTETGTVGHDTSGPTTDDAMTRSEERLQVGTQRVESGRARLRKYVVTENVTQTVPVSREEVRVEREPITEANRDAAYDGPAISEEEHEVVLHEERPVVAKEAVPVERVRLGTETVTEEQTVNEQVRKEQIDTDGVYPEGETSRTRTTDENLR